MFNFSGQVALVTGAAGNLGAAVARVFRAGGAKLVLADLSVERIQKVHSAWTGEEDIEPVAVDLTREDSVLEMVSQAKAKFGNINVLANIAGGFTMGPQVHETPVDDWDFMLNLNARSAFLASRAVLPMMLAAGGGKIISVAARAAREGKAKMAPYCVSKAAIITLTESMAAEYKSKNINVNCILPGTIDTPQNRESMPEADFGKWVHPTKLADVIAFLASDAASGINGAAIPVYGES